MKFRRISWLIALGLVAGVSLVRGGDLLEDLETMGKILAIPNTRSAQQLQVSLPDIGLQVGVEFLPGAGQRSFGRSLQRVVWLRHSTPDELEMVDIWGRELRIRIPRYMGEEKIRFKPVSTKGILEALATEYKTLAALPADPERPLDVSGGLGLAVHLYRRDEKAAAAQVIRWCQQLDRRRLGALTLDAIPVCYGGQYAFAWQRVEAYGDWHRYRSFCEDFLDRPQADRWVHTAALRALMPQIQVMASATPPAPANGVLERNFELLVQAMDAPENDLPDADWPIAILGDPRATSYRKRNRSSELRKELYKQDLGAIPFLARLLSDQTLVPMAATTADGGFRTPLTRGQVARRLLLATLPEELPAATTDAELAAAAVAFYRKSRPFSPIERAVKLAEAAPARFDLHVLQMLVESLPHDRTDAIEAILARSVGTDAGTTMAAGYLAKLGDDYRAPLDLYLAAFRESLAGGTMSEAAIATAVQQQRETILIALATESRLAAVELLALNPRAPNRPEAALTQALARDDGRLLRDIIRYLGDPYYRDGWMDLMAALEIAVTRQASETPSELIQKRLQFRELRPLWRAAAASNEPIELGNSMVIPLGHYLSMHVEGFIRREEPSPYVLLLPSAREVVRQRVLSRIEGLTDEMLPPMPLAASVPAARQEALISQLKALESTQVSAWLAARTPAERVLIAEREAMAGDMELVAKLAANRRRIVDVNVHPAVLEQVPEAVLQQWRALIGTTLSSAQVDAVEETMHGHDLNVAWRGLGGGIGTVLIVGPNLYGTPRLMVGDFRARWYMVGYASGPLAGRGMDAWESDDLIAPPEATDGETKDAPETAPGGTSAWLTERLEAIPAERRELFQAIRQSYTESDEKWWPATMLELVSFTGKPGNDAAGEAGTQADQGAE